MANGDANITVSIQARVDDLQRNIAGAVKTVQQGSQQIDVAAGKAAKAIEGINPASRSAGFALMNFNRVIQDAPFGIMAIANNIQELLPAYRQLVATSREAGQSVGKSLVQALIGGGGLSVAFNVVLSAITFASVGLQYWIRGNKEAKQAVDEQKKAIEGFTDAAGKELASLDTLYYATQNTNLSLSERKAAVDELQQQYPAYFKNLSDEAILAGKAASAYENLSNQIINKAIIQAAESDLQRTLKPYIEVISAQRKLQAEVDKRNREAQAKNPRESFMNSANSYRGFTAIEQVGATNAVVSENNTFIYDETQNTLKSVANYKKETTDAIKDARESVQSLLVDFGINSFIDPNKNFDDKKKKVKRDVELLGALYKDNIDEYYLNNSILGENPLAGGDQTALMQQMQNTVKMVAAKNAEADARNRNLKALAQEQMLMQNIASVVGQGLTGAFENLVNGTQSAIQSIGQFLQQLVSRILAAAAAAAVLAGIFSLFGLGGGFGAAASQIGSFKNLFNGFSGVTAFAKGGIISGPTLALMGEAGESEVVAPLSKFNQMVNERSSSNQPIVMDVEISGDKLLLVQKRAQNKYNRTT